MASLKSKNFFLAFFVSAPLFISVRGDFRLDLSRTVDVSDQDYLVSMPLALLFLGWVIFSYGLKSLFSSRTVLAGPTVPFLLIVVSSTLWVLTALLYPALVQYSIVSVLIWIFFFGIFHSFRYLNIKNYCSTVWLCLLIQVSFGLLARLSLLVFDGVYLGEVIPGYFAIYNFEQYFVLGAVLCFGVLCASFRNYITLILWFLVIFYLAQFSENITAQVLLVLFLIIGFFSRFKIFDKIASNPNAFVGLASAFLLVPFLFALIAWAYVAHELGPLGNPAASGLWARVVMHYNIIHNISFVDLLRPLAAGDYYGVLYGEPHHQFFYYWFYGGFSQALISFFCVLYLIRLSLPEQRLIFLIFFLIAGTTLEPMGHPFIFIQYFLFLAFSFIIKSRDSKLGIS